MPTTYLVKIFHSYDKGKTYIKEFFEDVFRTMEHKKMIFGLNYLRGEFFFSYTANDETYGAFESQFYSYFNDFQLTGDDK